MYALGIVKHMRDYVNFLRNEWHLNFSLLATAGELISGRFIDIDKELYKPYKTMILIGGPLSAAGLALIFFEMMTNSFMGMKM